MEGRQEDGRIDGEVLVDTELEAKRSIQNA